MRSVKLDQGKDRWELLPLGPIWYIVKVISYGAVKYAPNAWQRLPDFENRYYAAAMRHITAWRQGEKIDKESGLPHLAHALCNLVFLLWKDLRGGMKKV